jgi:LuxR family maltose regulon positive regulatory protein
MAEGVRALGRTAGARSAPTLAPALRSVPRPAGGGVDRPRLFDLLDAGIQGPLTVITGPPGAGKTTLLSSWLAARPPAATVAWLAAGAAHERSTLPPGGPGRFWRAVMEIVDGAADPQVLIVDDFHELQTPRACEQLDALLRHPPDTLRVVIASRADPPVSLARLRLEGRMTEVRAADLSFTADEAAALFSRAGLELTAGQLETLHARTEGWAAGLRLATLSLQVADDAGALIEAFAGDEHTVADYLIQEVLARQPAPIREFMLRTSVVDELCPELADALTGETDGARTLDLLERGNAFVSRVGDNPGLYRYHRMFGELLRSQLRHRMPGRLALQNRLAARWYARHGELTLASRHALAAGDGALAGNLLATNWPALLVGGEAPGAVELISGLPRALACQDPELAVAAAGALLECGELAQGQDYLRLADDTAFAVKPKRRVEFLVTRTIADLYEARALGDQDRVRAAAGRLLAGQGAGALALDGRDRRALALLALGIAETWSGRHRHARSALEDALVLARHAGRDYLVFCVLGALALLDALTGALTTSADAADEALTLAARHGWDERGSACAAHCAVAIVAHHRNRLGDAERSIAAACAIAPRAGDRALRLVVELTRAAIAVSAGALEQAQSVVLAASRAGSGWQMPAPLAVATAITRAGVMLAAGRADDARRAIAHLPAPGQWAETEVVWARLALHAGDPRTAARIVADGVDQVMPALTRAAAIELRALGAVAEHRSGDPDAALVLLEQALALAEPEQELSPFLAVGPPVRELLVRRIRAGTAHRSLAGELGELLDPHTIAAADRRSAMALEPLSEREEVVLRYLPTTLSKAEIASEMRVSVNTVKTHMKNIYRKLDVTDRAQAIRRARTLHLV